MLPLSVRRPLRRAERGREAPGGMYALLKNDASPPPRATEEKRQAGCRPAAAELSETIEATRPAGYELYK